MIGFCRAVASCNDRTLASFEDVRASARQLDVFVHMPENTNAAREEELMAVPDRGQPNNENRREQDSRKVFLFHTLESAGNPRRQSVVVSYRLRRVSRALSHIVLPRSFVNRYLLVPLYSDPVTSADQSLPSIFPNPSRHFPHCLAASDTDLSQCRSSPPLVPS